ncbi:MAG: helix-turn-helix transcriptional regulator [Rhizobacter sp.]
MLDIPDTEVVRAWLATALEIAAKKGQTPADLARHCKVTPQAVNGWISKGRITKKNLELASQFLGSSPSFSHPAHFVREPSAVYGWPFKTVDLAEVTALPPKLLSRLEKTLRDRLDEWADDQSAAGSGKQRGRG